VDSRVVTAESHNVGLDFRPDTATVPESGKGAELSAYGRDYLRNRELCRTGGGC